jgi:hypothetical protein
MLAEDWMFWRIVNEGLATISEADALDLADIVRANVMLDVREDLAHAAARRKS